MNRNSTDILRPSVQETNPTTSEPNLSIRETIFFSTQQQSHFREGSGPELELFFHELTGLQSRLKRPIDIVGGFVGVAVMAILFPFIWVGIKLSSKGRVIVREKCTGLYGIPFQQFKFKTRQEGNPIHFGSLLKKINLHKLPSFINIIKGEMSLVGPAAIPEKTALRLNNQYTDFFKRYAVQPGLIHINGIPEDVKKLPDEVYFQYQLKNELKYIAKPTIRKDFSTLVHRFLP